MDFRRALAPFIAFLIASHAVCGSASPAPDAPQAAAATASAPNHILESFRHDASLADVCFINPTTGWAVGDHGVIWHTQDAGATWIQQSSNVSCPLHSVFFIDARRGWIVGGDSPSHTGASRGIVLRTLDGGNHWDAIPRLILPQLARVKFFDQQRGIAIGAAAPTQPSGVFLTQDGGDSWQPIPSDHHGGWLTGDFLDPQAGALAGPAGRVAQLARQKVVHPPLQMHSLRAYRALRLLPPTAGWLVGDGGLILTTPDLGRTWQSPPGEVARPGDVASATGLFDFQALAALGPRVWTAGAPGSRVFHSPDNGQTWLSFPTGQLAPIRALAFIDDHHGWAVGDLGNILATSDGGQTWKPQRTGGSRAALLGIFAHAADVPLEVLAAHAAADGYRTAIDILHPPGEVASATGPLAHPTPHHHREALLLTGASHVNTAWRFPLPPSDLAHTPADLLAALNRDSDGRAVEQIEQHLVRSIRTWQPDVIITPQPNPESCPPRQAILAALVMQSITAAADPSRHADLASAGLEPWQVKKVYALLPTGSHGAESIETNQFSPLLGTTLGNFVDPARESLAPTPAKPPLRYDFDLLTATIQDTGGPRGLFAGLSLAPGADPRRPQPAPPAEDLDQLRRIAERRQQLEALLSRTEGNDAWAAQIAQLTHDLNPNDGAPLMTQLADGYRAAGRLDLAADTYYLLARRYPDHAHAARALQWLVHFYASTEMSHRLTSRTPHNVRQAAFESPPGEAASAAGASGLPAPSAPALSPDDRLHRATQLAEYLRSSKPELYADPRVRFAEVAALRQLGLVNPAKRYHLALRQLPDANPWRQCGETEIWLAKPADAPPPKPLGACRSATQRPRLDAQLNDPFWNTTDRLRLSDKNDESTNTPPAEVRLAYDNEHLYIAIRCQKAPSPHPPPPTPQQPRPRDADLSQHDRVTLRFDVDRDFTTAFELTVDSRGWTHDACWNDAHWNPTWYVAAASDEAAWTIEAAVPLAELVETPPAPRHVWAVAASRTIPRVGFQHWASTTPADDSPDLFGFLLFE